MQEIVQFYEVKENESIKKKSWLVEVHKNTSLKLWVFHKILAFFAQFVTPFVNFL